VTGATGHPLSGYFERSYPSRSTLWGRLFFRHGEKERDRIVREWLPSAGGLRVLEAGCGDGAFLAAVISGRPARLRVEDISPRAVAAAAHRLAGRADEVESAVVDAMEPGCGGFDAVLAVGVLDYHPDLARSLERLLRRSRGVLIVSVPRRDHPRNWLRRAWFALRGGAFLLAGRGGTARAAAALGRPFDIRRGPYEWFLRIHPAGTAHRTAGHPGYDESPHD